VGGGGARTLKCYSVSSSYLSRRQVFVRGEAEIFTQELLERSLQLFDEMHRNLDGDVMTRGGHSTNRVSLSGEFFPLASRAGLK
jgi:hypothetical protein